MRIVFTLLISFLFIHTTKAQEITGTWNGLLKLNGMQLRLVFHVAHAEHGYKSTMDSPDQGAKGIPVTETTFSDSIITFYIKSARISYTGALRNNEIAGTFSQNGYELPLILSKNAIEKPTIKRPQEPKPPFPYHAEEVIFKNEQDSITLAGTLTLPQSGNNFPVVILITGSGPQNRDEELLEHKPFLVIADYLTKNGIAVLRFDDRGVGKSTGNFSKATTADFANDVLAAVNYIKSRKEINPKKIGLIGHSEGGMIAPMVAGKTKDVAFMILLAAPGIPGNKLLLLQQELIARANGASENDIQKTTSINEVIFNHIIQTNDPDLLKKNLTAFISKQITEDTGFALPEGQTADQFLTAKVNSIVTPWTLFFVRYNPAKNLKNIRIPVLALNGEKDLQVPSKINLEAIQNAMGKNAKRLLTTKELPGLNHLFQQAETGSPNEYFEIEETFNEAALKLMLDWMKQHNFIE